MPLFDFKCRKCNHEFEILLSGSEKAKCPACGDFDLEKLMSSYKCRPKTGRGSKDQCGGCAKTSCAGCH